MASRRWLNRSLFMMAVLGTPRVVLAAPPPEPAAAPEPTAASTSELAGFNRCDKQPRDSRFRITLPPQAELADLVGWISSVSCQKFVWDPAVRGGKITIVAPEPVTLAEAYGAFHSALATMNLAVEDAGGFFEIVETKGIAGRTLPVVGPDGQPTAGSRFVTQLLRPHPERIADVAAVLEHLKSEHGEVQSVGDLVIMTDTADNIRRAMTVVEEVDVAEATRDGLYVYPLAVADAEQVAELLRQILDDGEGETKAKAARRPAPASVKKPARQADVASDATLDTTRDTAASASSAIMTRVVPDVRSRSLFIVAPRHDYPVIRELIGRLDTAMPGDVGELSVIRLSHADPVELQGVLAQVIGARKTEGATQVSVTAEPATRSLVVDAPFAEMQRIKSVIASLDVERRQVYMEIYLLEVTMDHNLETGASAHFGKQNDDGTLGLVRSQPSSSHSSLAPSNDLLGFAGAIFGPTFNSTLLGQDVPSFGVLIQALETNTDVNTISEPHVTTADNKTAKIEIGEVVPFRSSTTYPGGPGGDNGLTPQVNISRESVALSVEITPHVNDEHEVTLDIKLSNEQLLAAADQELGFRTSKRLLELQDVVARDGQPVVLGGLIKEEDSVIESKVPGLGSIPVFGWLFKSRSRPRRKVNLLMILIPHVIDSPDDARRIHERRLAERREFIERETAFKRRDLDLHVNYRSKPGLLSAVDAEYRHMRIEDQHRTRAEAELQRGLPSEITPPRD